MTTPDIDTLIAFSISYSQVETNRVKSTELPAALFAGANKQLRRAKEPRWTKDEERFLQDNLGYLTDTEIGAALGRTENAIKVHRVRDMGLYGPSKAPGVITARKAADMLGIDMHKTAYWVDQGLIPGRRMAGERVIRLITRADLDHWVLNTDNWIYFDIYGIQDPRLRKMAIRHAKYWGDAWLKTEDVAELHGVQTSDVKRYIQKGWISARQTKLSLGGRDPQMTWARWFILRSEAERVKFYKMGSNKSMFSKSSEAWILYAHDLLEMKFTKIARLMNGRRQARGLIRPITDGAVYARYMKLQGAPHRKGKA